MTSSSFTKDARKYADESNSLIELIDFNKLIEMIKRAEEKWSDGIMRLYYNYLLRPVSTDLLCSFLPLTKWWSVLEDKEDELSWAWKTL